MIVIATAFAGFWRGDPGQRPDFAARLAGSSDLFDTARGRPWASVNYAASHDGFTLMDTVSYAERHNETNGEDNRDGSSENYSANWGTEGPTDDQNINETRARLCRAMLATVLFSHGTPMLLGGDEFDGRSKAITTPIVRTTKISWTNWKLAEAPDGQSMIDFVSRLLALRREHPVLRCRHFLHGKEELAKGIRDISWFNYHGDPIPGDLWNNPDKRAIGFAPRGEDAGWPRRRLDHSAQSDRRKTRISASHRRMYLQASLVNSGDPALAPYNLNEDKITLMPQSVVLLRGYHEGSAMTQSFLARFAIWRAPFCLRTERVFGYLRRRSRTSKSKLRVRIPDLCAGLTRGWFEAEHRAGAPARIIFMSWTMAAAFRTRFARTGARCAWVERCCRSAAYLWQIPEWRGRAWQETIIYELHCGLYGGLSRCCGGAAAPGRSRCDGRRVDADQRFFRHAQLGL